MAKYSWFSVSDIVPVPSSLQTNGNGNGNGNACGIPFDVVSVACGEMEQPTTQDWRDPSSRQRIAVKL